MRENKYRWRQRLRAGRFVMRRGVDYDKPTHSVLQQLRNAAAKLGYSIDVTDIDDGISVIAVKKTEAVV